MATFNPLAYYPKLPVPPNLPLAPYQYDSRYQEAFNNVLRLYFNQLNGLIATLAGARGGKFLDFPYGAFHQDGTTTLTVAIPNGVSTAAISVASTDGFPASGSILIGTEVIQYTTKTATTFGGTITRSVFGTTGSSHPVGAAITEVQGTGSPTTIGTMRLSATDYSNGVSLDTAQTSILFADPGLYNVQFSVQFLNFTTTDDNVAIWFYQNGADVPLSAGIITVPSKHGSVPGATIAGWNEFFNVASGDTLAIKWASDSGNTVVATYPAGTSPVHPVSPALAVSVQFVSAPPG